MNKEVVLSIVDALEAAFDYPVRIDGVEQELTPPCFLVEKVQGGQKKEIGNRYKNNNYFDIKYLTETEKPMMELLGVEEKLYDCLEYIEINGSPTKGTDMKGSVIDGVLHFFVNYNFHVFKRTVQEESMQKITIKTEFEKK